MTEQNKQMTLMIRNLTGVKDVNCKYIKDGSMKGTWRMNSKKVNWYNNFELHNSLKTLFVDFDKDELDNFSGNGGLFSIFARVR